MTTVDEYSIGSLETSPAIPTSIRVVDVGSRSRAQAARVRKWRGVFSIQPYDYVLLATALAAVVLWSVTGIPFLPVRAAFTGPFALKGMILVIGLVLLLVYRVAQDIGRSGRIRPRVARALFSRHFGPRTLVDTLHYATVFVFVMTLHTTLKQAIPLINAARYDEQLIQLERIVHFGFNPAWDLTSGGPQSSSSVLTAGWLLFLDNCYYLWFAALPLSVAYFLTHRNRRKSELYLAAFAGIWIVGGLIGLAFPSHGPCFVDRLRFPPSEMDLCRLVQGWLWEHYTTMQQITWHGAGGLEFGRGLMAMPSLHVSVCCLYAIFLWNEGLWWRWASILFALAIFLGSIYSGWHYAIDAYGGLALAAFVAWIVRKLPSSAGPRRAL